MTYGEIYDSILFYAWGDATPPSGAQTNLIKMISSAQRKVCRDYNFWFMLTSMTIPLVIGQRSYDLGTRFKEIEFCNISTPSGAKTTPLNELDISSHNELLLELSDGDAEYPEYYMSDGANIVLYPTPSAVKTLNVRLWKFLDPIPTVYATMRTYTDNVSTYLAEAIIFHVLSELKLVENEWQASDRWKQKFFEEMQIAVQEDVRRRQNATGRYHSV